MEGTATNQSVPSEEGEYPSPHDKFGFVLVVSCHPSDIAHTLNHVCPENATQDETFHTQNHNWAPIPQAYSIIPLTFR